MLDFVDKFLCFWDKTHLIFSGFSTGFGVTFLCDFFRFSSAVLCLFFCFLLSCTAKFCMCFCAFSPTAAGILSLLITVYMLYMGYRILIDSNIKPQSFSPFFCEKIFEFAGVFILKSFDFVLIYASRTAERAYNFGRNLRPFSFAWRSFQVAFLR